MANRRVTPWVLALLSHRIGSSHKSLLNWEELRISNIDQEFTLFQN
jgi:hypothetical protein